jgi:hypothetical protein
MPGKSKTLSKNKGIQMKKLSIKTILVILFLLPLSSFAKSPYYMSIHTAGHVFESNRNIGDTFLLGLGLGYHFNQHFNAAVRLYTGKYKIQYPKYNQTCISDRLTGNLYHADLYYRFLPKNLIRPYITGGIGIFSLKHSISEELYGDYFDQGMLLNYGAGLEFFVKDISVLGDVRHFMSTGDSRNEMVIPVGIAFRLAEWE